MKAELMGSGALGAIAYLAEGEFWRAVILAGALAVVWVCLCAVLAAALRTPRREGPCSRS